MTQTEISNEDNIVEGPQKVKASKALLAAGWFFAIMICLIGAVIGPMIQNHPNYDESSRQQGKAIRYTSYAVFLITIIVINSQKN